MRTACVLCQWKDIIEHQPAGCPPRATLQVTFNHANVRRVSKLLVRKKKKRTEAPRHPRRENMNPQALCAAFCKTSFIVAKAHHPTHGENKHARSHSNTLAPRDGACSSLPSHPTLHCCSPSLMGDSTKAATVDVSQARKTTVHLTLKTRRCSSHTVAPDTRASAATNGAPEWAQQEYPLKCCSLLPSRSPRLPTLPLPRKRLRQSKRLGS